jgi:phosphohistidine phosphatase
VGQFGYNEAMKRLTILRHAKSSWDDPKHDDVNRPLNERGWKAARRIGRELKHRDFHFDLVLASPAARTRETIDGVQQKFDFDAPIKFDPRLYLASESLLLAMVQELAEAVHRPLLVGHNPGLHQLVLSLIHDGGQARSKVQHKFPTAALAVVELPAHRWTEVEPGTGKLVDLILPKELD